MNDKQLGEALALSEIPRELQAALGFAASFVATCPDSVWERFVVGKLQAGADADEIAGCHRHRDTLKRLKAGGRASAGRN